MPTIKLRLPTKIYRRLFVAPRKKYLNASVLLQYLLRKVIIPNTFVFDLSGTANFVVMKDKIKIYQNSRVNRVNNVKYVLKSFSYPLSQGVFSCLGIVKTLTMGLDS